MNGNHAHTVRFHVDDFVCDQGVGVEHVSGARPSDNTLYTSFGLGAGFASF